MKAQRVRTKVNQSLFGQQDNFHIDGLLSQKTAPFLTFWLNDKYLGYLEGQKLYRLAKAIVRRFEGE